MFVPGSATRSMEYRRGADQTTPCAKPAVHLLSFCQSELRTTRKRNILTYLRACYRLSSQARQYGSHLHTKENTRRPHVRPRTLFRRRRSILKSVNQNKRSPTKKQAEGLNGLARKQSIIRHPPCCGPSSAWALQRGVSAGGP